MTLWKLFPYDHHSYYFAIVMTEKQIAAMRVDAALAHVFVGANAISNAFFGYNSLESSFPSLRGSTACAFGAKNAVALVGRTAKGANVEIHETLQHRVDTKDTTRITSVYFQDRSGGSARVLAGDSEGNIFLWQRGLEADADWKFMHVNKDLQIAVDASVAAMTGAETKKRWLYFVTFSTGVLLTLEVFKQEPNIVKMACQLNLGVKMIMETLSATTIAIDKEEEQVLLAAGGVDSKIYLYELPSGSSQLSQLMALEGHRGWVRSLSFQHQQSQLTPFFLASASQDQRIRLWKVTAVVDDSESASSLNNTHDGFRASGACLSYTVSFDALLLAHEDWVTSLAWTLLPSSGSDTDETTTMTLALVSCSMDNTLIVWTKGPSSVSWLPSLRVGEMGGNGFLSGVVLPMEADKRLDLLVLNFSGQLERWKQQPAPSKIFLPAESLTGHCSSVTDLSWSPRGDYLLSVSLDQTARVYAPLTSEKIWYEISRAQVHGYDLNCACFLLEHNRDDQGNDRYVSGADEKILRVFEAPDEVQTLVNRLNNTGTSIEAQHPRILHAYLPELSLTNKSSGAQNSKDPESGGYVELNDKGTAPVRLPVGDTLSKKTLWPEQRKLYGHGNELLCVASNHSGTMIASACKSREERFASVWLWNTTDWSVRQSPLEGHKSSVVQLEFSPNDQYLLSVSKDRQFCLYEKNDSDQFQLIEKVKAHKRIIWTCSWSPDSVLFVTGSRDQSIAFWGKNAEGKWSIIQKPIVMPKAVTAAAFAPASASKSSSAAHPYLLAVGLESGAIKLFSVIVTADFTSLDCQLVCEVALAVSPSSMINRLAWSTQQDSNDLLLAAASTDYSVRLYHVHRS